MNYCLKCGAYLGKDAGFCQKCGHSAGGHYASGEENRSSYIRTVIKRSEAPQEMKAITKEDVYLIIASIVLLFIAFASASSHINTPSWYSDSGRFGVFAILLFVLVLAMSSTFLVKFRMAKSFLCVCEEGIYGQTIMGTPFEVEYGRISYVTRHQPANVVETFIRSFYIRWWQHRVIMQYSVIIICGPHTYECLTSDPEDVIALIERMTSSAGNNSAGYQSPEKEKPSGSRPNAEERKGHKFLDCPGCSCTLRVPADKGKIRVNCPRCGKMTLEYT